LLVSTSTDPRHLALAQELERRECDTWVSANPQDIEYYSRGTFRAGFLVCLRGGLPFLVCHPGLSLLPDNPPRLPLFFEEESERLLPRVIDECRRVHAQAIRCIAVSGIGVSTAQRLAHGCEAGELIESPEIGALPRRSKEPGELELLRQAAAIASEAAEGALLQALEGKPEWELALRAERIAFEGGADGTWFPVRCACGERCVNPDLEPGARLLRAGDIGYLDIGILHRGYAGDCTRVIAIGTPGLTQRRIVDAVRRALDAGKDALRPGAPSSGVHRVVAGVLTEAGRLDRYFPHHAGHGLGVLGADLPRFTPGSTDTIREGDVVTLEPGVYVPGTGGCRLEETFLIRDDGPELLSVPRAQRRAKENGMY
jgi:Xaa-Pro aminopeptidase